MEFPTDSIKMKSSYKNADSGSQQAVEQTYRSLQARWVSHCGMIQQLLAFDGVSLHNKDLNEGTISGCATWRLPQRASWDDSDHQKPESRDSDLFRNTSQHRKQISRL